jgi:hypothetical protein
MIGDILILTTIAIVILAVGDYIWGKVSRKRQKKREDEFKKNFKN